MKQINTIFWIIFIHFGLNSPLSATELCQSTTQMAPSPPDLPPVEAGLVQIIADHARATEQQNVLEFTGDVTLQKEQQTLSTDTLLYDRNQDKVDIESQFTLWDDLYVLQGEKLQLHNREMGEIANGYYWLLGQGGHGRSTKVIRKDKNTLYLENASYTTCNPDKEIWRLESKNTVLNKAEAEGVSRDVTLKLFDIPVFYTPYLSYPLNDARKSGILAPSLGSSNEVGVEFSLPYYFNLAPNYDATLTPRIMTKRGLMLQGEFRYLTQQTGGRLQAEYLPNDRSLDKDRSSVVFQHSGQVVGSLFADINYNYVSDDHYFEELGNNLTVASVTHLERRADLTYWGTGWALLGRVQRFQTLDPNPAAHPYQRMPQLLFKTYLPERNKQFNYGLQAEAVRFDHEALVEKPVGNRFDLVAELSHPWRTPGTFLVPKVTLRHTRYDLQDVMPDISDSPSRNTYTFSADTGLFFERSTNLFNTALVQTLEPRLFYRYTPYEDQSDIPVFDTDRFDLSYYQLFRENAFNGADRIDDGHQVTVALSSRFFQETTGAERFRASIGQIIYFRDREVILPYEEIDTNNTSPIVLELASQFADHWYAATTFHYDTHDKETKHSMLRLRYHQDGQHLVNASYRLREGKLEQTDVSTYWGIGQHWNAIGRWNYSLRQRKDIEAFLGVEYDSCCWATRLVMRRYLNNFEGEYHNGIYLQFYLKGLGGLGKKANTLLEESIPGFVDRF